MNTRSANKPEWVALAVVTTPHGVSGRVKVKSFTEPMDDFASHTHLTDEKGTPVKFRLTGHAQGTPVIEIEGLRDRNEAELWRGRKLGLARDALPTLPENQYYTDDLTGMQVVTEAGEVFGSVIAVVNYGAGDLLEIERPGGREELYSFIHANFPKVDTTRRLITITPPDILGGKDEEPPEETA